MADTSLPHSVTPDDEIGPAKRSRSPRAQERTIDISASDGDTRAPGDLLDLPPMPKRIGGFTLIEPLGMGGMGHVYLARQDSLERLVALKILRNELAKDKVYLERFQREAKAAALFSHPHVVPVIDTGHDREEDLYYIAFEYVDGGSLESLVRAKGPIPERRALEITRAIALALQFAESRRLIHRDLKPANILLAADGTPKLADLGLVRTAERVGPQVTQEGVILGTPLYMAPEQALGRDIDVRADIYSLGLCLYRMLSGRVPFNDAEETCSTLQILSRHVNEELPDVRDVVGGISEATVRLMGEMTAREVERRYRSAAHVAQEIDRLLTGQTLQGARALMCSSESEAPTTAVKGIRPEDLLERPAADPSPTVAAPLMVLPLPDKAAAAVGPAPARATPPAALPAPPRPGAAPPSGGTSVVAILAVAAVATVVGVGFLIKAKPSKTSSSIVTTTATERAGSGPEPVPGIETTEPPVDPDAPRVTETTPTPATERPVDPRPVDPPPVAATGSAPTPVEPGDSTPAATGRDAVAAAIDAAHGDPDKIALLVRDVSRELFTDVPRGREHARLLLERSGWSPSPVRDRFQAAIQAVVSALEPAIPNWDERLRRLHDVARLTRERMTATELEKLKAAVDVELQRWNVFAANAGRVRLALGDPRTEEQALRTFDSMPEEWFVREDARALLAMGRAADQPDRWVRIEDRRKDVALGVRELRERVERTALACVIAEEATVLARVLERQLDDPHASLPTALLRTWNEGTLLVAGQKRDPKDSVFLQARRREVPRGAPWTNLSGWALAVELGAPLTGSAAVTITIDDEMTVHLGPAGIVASGVFNPCRLAGAAQVLVEPRFDGLLLRMPGATPEEIMVALPEGPVVPVRFSVRAQEAQVTRLVLVRLPERQQADPKSIRGESVRRGR